MAGCYSTVPCPTAPGQPGPAAACRQSPAPRAGAGTCLSIAGALAARLFQMVDVLGEQ